MRKPSRPPARQPWEPYPYEAADAYALKALAAGIASEGQQRRAVAWIIAAAGTYDLPFRPGPEGDRATAFASGMQHVGKQVVKLINIPNDLLQGSPHSG